MGRKSCSLLTYTHLTHEAQGMGVACLNPCLESDLENSELSTIRVMWDAKMPSSSCPGMATFILKNKER